ncbi:MAG: glycosyltransferase family 2 protein [Cytophagales bacterium]|nr:glycosyltransferase family 2 protein [Bernardetiaceae bacterium]MDW8204051.1 glycosyltransferase family 2 protein [Cytophagales bacterium]
MNHLSSRPKISGFTIVRNAIKYDYPVVESIQSILPVCDEVVVAVGKSEDDTLELIRNIPSDKIKILETVWDESLRTGGKVLAAETNKAFDAVSPDADWAFYIQADEVLHEKYHPVILEATTRYLHNEEVEGLLFHYTHFYGTYRFVADSRNWYRHEIRIIRNQKDIRSYRDAQGFRRHNRKLRVKLIDAHIYHYGWVKNPYQQQQKMQDLHVYWSDVAIPRHVLEAKDLYDYGKIDSVTLFQGTHPLVMQKRINSADWEVNLDPTVKNLSLKNRILATVEQLTGKRLFEYKNYELI